jgi:hypothetical protein
VNDADLSDRFVDFSERGTRGKYKYIGSHTIAPFSWYSEKREKNENIKAGLPTGGFIIWFSEAKSPVPIKAVIPLDNASYMLYYLPCEIKSDYSTGQQKITYPDDELFSVLTEYETKMSAPTIWAVTYLDKEGEAIHTQIIDLGPIMPTIYRKFYFAYPDDRNYQRTAQVFTVAPGYVNGEKQHLFLGSANFNKKFDAGWYIELDENDLQRLDSMKLEVVFENQ